VVAIYNRENSRYWSQLHALLKTIQNSTSPPKIMNIIAEDVIFPVSGGVAAARSRSVIFASIGRIRLFLKDTGAAGKVDTVAMRNVDMA
jgi:hypothetical protein